MPAPGPLHRGPCRDDSLSLPVAFDIRAGLSSSSSLLGTGWFWHPNLVLLGTEQWESAAPHEVFRKVTGRLECGILGGLGRITGGDRTGWVLLAEPTSATHPSRTLFLMGFYCFWE